MGREAASSPPSASASCLRQFDVFLLLDAASDGNDDVCLRQIDGLLGFFEDLLRLIADDAVGDFDVHRFDGRGACTRFHFVSAKRTVLERHEPRRFAGKAHVGGEFSLEHLASEKAACRLPSCNQCNR